MTTHTCIGALIWLPCQQVTTLVPRPGSSEFKRHTTPRFDLRHLRVGHGSIERVNFFSARPVVAVRRSVLCTTSRWAPARRKWRCCDASTRSTWSGRATGAASCVNRSVSKAPSLKFVLHTLRNLLRGPKAGRARRRVLRRYSPHFVRIRGRRLGPVFRRQVPLLGRYIADFLAPAERLVIEVDGGHHAEQARADARRDAVLARAGYRIVRLDAALVTRDIETAVSLVRAALAR
jgi:very-short-patch-repair endonuclease